MIKKHLLSVAILFALTGCNDDLLLDTAHQTVPAMPNANVFDDINHNGLQDIDSEPTLTTTDTKGRFRLSTTTTLQGDLAIKSQDDVLVLRTPNDEKIISALTDLVVIEMNKERNQARTTKEEVILKQNAINKVESELGVTNTEKSPLFSHFISEQNNVLTDTAEYLTATKIGDPIAYEKNSLLIASTASQLANNPIKCSIEEQTLSITAEGERVCNAPITINPNLKAHLQQSLPSPLKGTAFDGFEASLFDLFNNDIDLGSNSNSSPITLYSPTLSATGITASILWGSNLKLSSTNLVSGGGTHLITLMMDDIGLNLGTLDNPKSNYEKVSTTSVTFEFTILEDDRNISINVESHTQLQNTIAQWDLSVDDPFSATLTLSSLFHDPADTFSHVELKYIDIHGLDSFDQNTSSMTIEGTPLYAAEAGKALIISGIDKQGEHVDAIFSLPEVKSNYLPPEIEYGANLEDRFIYINPIESLRDDSGNHLGSGVVCEIRYFNSLDSSLYSYARILESYSECPVFPDGTIPSESNGFENYGQYTREQPSNRITFELEEDGEFMTITYQAQEISTNGESHLLMHNSESMGNESMYSLNTGYLSTEIINSVLAQPIDSDITSSVSYLDANNNPLLLSVTAFMPSRVEAGEAGSADANLILHNMKCAQATSIYSFTADYSIMGNPMMWDLETTYKDKDGNCHVDFSSQSRLSSAIHTLYGEVNTPYAAKYEEISFSFNNLKD
ncbi:hypothetical protein ERW51_13545 [Aliivibrio finisterrensis]|uniref:hypothetical protein n=1 Tax=Aliivibrio finisterrensis TaxID=511998 RepID=UPI0010204BC9|nr:hypothetical protein [Aliivibrio finisterrensis]RYU66684.1 hypothetical protein ERW54_13780 [Aliivibrio finisterrensis]RYU69753.1 hypothetical protein ERW51_13545 [Aliivibrio finisterrensis]RYU73540.1 hypothetical protein ERW48_12620 [Aliivibrio finisterrensis]